MKVLYAAMRHDPRDIDRSSSVDYSFYTAICNEGHEVRVTGPFLAQPSPAERVVKRAHDLVFRKRYLKWDVGSMRASSRAVEQTAAEWRPDVIFTIFPSTLAFYRGATPYVFNTDLTFVSWQANGANFSRPALWWLNRLERRIVRGSGRLLLFSERSRREMMAQHGVSAEQIIVMPMPSALPLESVPQQIDIAAEKQLESPLRLLLVGRESHRKGVDIAIEATAQLNARGIPAELTVCAGVGPPAPFVRYVGPFRKSRPEELAQYTELYRRAHLLLHPARYEPAGIVPGEAAAFATPTVTNDVGGLATTVADGVSGVVLPGLSPAAAYVEAIAALTADPARYYALCASTRARYERELNWAAAGRTVTRALAEAAATRGRR